MALIIDPEFRDWIEAVDEETDEALKESLLRDADVETPVITVWAGKNIIVDGHRRYRMCLQLNIKYTVIEKEFKDRDEVLYWMNLRQASARNSPSQKRSERRSWQLGYVKRQKTIGATQAVKSVAAKSDVSTRTVYRDQEYVEALPKLQEEVRQKIQSGELKASKKTVTELGKLDPAYQASLAALVESGTYKHLAQALNQGPNRDDPVDESDEPIVTEPPAEDMPGSFSDTVSVTGGKPGRGSRRKAAVPPAVQSLLEAEKLVGRLLGLVHDAHAGCADEGRLAAAKRHVNQLAVILDSWKKFAE